MENMLGKSLLLFRIQTVTYAVESRAVISILQEAGKITPLPQTDAFVRGIMLLRGSVVPVMDLRMVLGLPTVEQEYEEFVKMLAQRKQEHIAWAEALQQSAETGKPFRLADDPHKCAFGKWYDAFEAQNRTVAFHMKKIDDPHRELHEHAKDVKRCIKKGKTLKDDPEIEDIVEDMNERLVPAIVGLLDEAVGVFKSSYRQMAVTLEYQGEKLALLVDAVQAVRTFTGGAGKPEPQAEKFGKLPYIDYIDEQLGVIRIMQLDDLFGLMRD